MVFFITTPLPPLRGQPSAKCHGINCIKKIKSKEPLNNLNTGEVLSYAYRPKRPRKFLETQSL
jgi:hypothetical protein